MAETTNLMLLPSAKKKYGTTDRMRADGYSISFSDFVANTNVWIKLFTDHLPGFTGLDAELNIGYADNWQALCEELAGTTTDETMRDEIAHRTSELHKIQRQFMPYANDLEYYLSKAFPADPRKVDELGIKLLRRELNRNTWRFSLYATVLVQYATRYQTELTTAGLPLTWWAEAEMAAARIQQAEIHQEVAKRERIQLTTLRNNRYSAMYRIWQRVNHASKVIYRGNESMLKLWQWK